MICRCGSIREAARHLHVDGSAVNRQLLNLEEEVGATLFERLPGGLRLTEAGRLFAQHVVTVLQDEQRVIAEIERLQGLERGEVHLAAAESLSAGLLPAVLDRMASEHPKVALHVSMLGSGTIAQRVASGDVDIGAAFAMSEHPELTCVASGQFRLGAVMAPDHPLAARRRVTFDECAEYGLIMPNPDVAVHAILAPLVARARRPVRAVVHSGAIELMRQLAMRGTGIGFQTRIGLDEVCAAGRLAFVPLDEAEQAVARLGFYVRATRALPPAVTALLAILGDALERLLEAEARMG